MSDGDEDRVEMVGVGGEGAERKIDRIKPLRGRLNSHVSTQSNNSHTQPDSDIYYYYYYCAHCI